MLIAWTTAVNFMKGLGWKDWIMVVALGLILVLITTCTVDNITDHIGQNRQVEANNEDREIREDLSVKRQETEAQITESERKLNEELAKLPDAVPSPRRLARACGELRDRGYQPLPASCGSGTN